MGPYEVDTVYDNGAVKIKTIDDGQVSFVVNGHGLKFYHKPISREDFLQVMSADKAFALVYGEVPPCSWMWFFWIFDYRYVNNFEVCW